MVSMEVCHDTVSAGWWNDHLFTLGEEVTVNGEFITEAPVESGHSGDTTLSVRPTVQGESVKGTKIACFGIKAIYNIYKDHLRALHY